MRRTRGAPGEGREMTTRSIPTPNSHSFNEFLPFPQNFYVTKAFIYSFSHHETVKVFVRVETRLRLRLRLRLR